MSTPYEEMVTAAEAYKNRHDSARQFIERLIPKFAGYCQTTADTIKLMRYDKNLDKFTITGNEFVTIYEAIRYDDASDEWSVALKLIMSPSVNTAFGIAVTEKNSRYFVRAGGSDEQQHPVHLEDRNSTDWFFAAVVAMIKESFLPPSKTSPPKRLGFHVGTGSDVSI